MAYRLEKLSSLIKEEVSLIFLKELRSDLGFVTITRVKVSPDVRHANVYLSIMEKERREPVMQKVETHKKFIRRCLAGRLTIRFVPELHFFLDDSLDYVDKMEVLFKKIHEDDNKEES